MAAKKQTSRVVWLRRGVQAFFLLLFLYLLLQATYYPINQTGGPVKFFFELDPLVLVSSWLAADVIPRALLLSVVVLVVTLLLGRWFCGWVCPFGALNQFITSLRDGKAKARMRRGGYSEWQKVKYWGLAALLLAALAGINLIGWVDPFSFFFRSVATSIYPAVNSGIQSFFTWLYFEDFGIGPVRVTVISEPVYEFLRSHFLAVEQPHYTSGILLGLIFFGVVGLSLVRPRFWCRYVCPLGAMLGTAGKNPALILKKNDEVCNDCGYCLADCPGGADPNKSSGWRPSECFYCWNCKSNCPHDAITFGFGVPKDSTHEEARR